MAAFRQLVSLAWRESRTARRKLLLYMSSISLGVAALVAIDSFSENVIQSVHDQSRALMGGDVAATRNAARSRAVDSLVDSLARHGIPSATATDFLSMGLVPRTGGTRLVQVHAVSPGYPFYGTITTAPAAAWAQLQSGHHVVVDPSLLVSLNAHVGDSLSLGYLLAIAFGCWLYLGRRVGPVVRHGGTAALLVGLIAAYSRGPWLGAVVIYFVYILLGPHAITRTFKASFIAGVAFIALLMSPLGPRITKVIPFLGGEVDNFNILYREVLAERSLDMIRLHPFLGDQDAYSKLQDLRQGVGVIDFVNTYADVAVFYGLIGLGLFVGLPLSGIAKDWRVLRKARRADLDLSLQGASLAACAVGTLVMIYTSSFIFGYAVLFYVLAGLGAGYASAGYGVQRVRSRAGASPSLPAAQPQPQPQRRAYGPPHPVRAMSRLDGPLGGAGRSAARAFRSR